MKKPSIKINCFIYRTDIEVHAYHLINFYKTIQDINTYNFT